MTVPVDIGIIGATGSSAFALATPLRVAQLVAMGIEHALGARAPRDKRERVLHTTLAGLARGHFTVDIDGRLFNDPDEVVVCSGSVNLRFFLSAARDRTS